MANKLLLDLKQHLPVMILISKLLWLPLKAGIILLQSRIAIRVIVDNLRRENQLYLWLFVKMF